jgi:hypothetical protein
MAAGLLVASLPPAKAIDDPPTYPVLLSPRLQALKEEVERQLVTTELEPAQHRPRELSASR